MPRIFRKRRPLRRPRRKAARPTFAKKVLAVVAKRTEVKEAFTSVSSSTTSNKFISTDNSAFQIIPNMLNGNLNYQRVGDNIVLKSHSVTGAMVYSPFTSIGNTSRARIAVRMMIIQPKQLREYTQATGQNSWYNSMLQKGGTNSGFDGTMSALWAPFNLDVVTPLYNKIFYISQTDWLAGTTSTNVPQDLSKTVKFFKVNLKVAGKKLRYDTNQNSGLTPLNYSPILCFGYVPLDGSTGVSGELAISYDASMKYTDA